jgi:purine nucleosidase
VLPVAPRFLIIDCDPGQDDAVALLMAMASPEAFDLLGVTTVGGNVSIERTSTNARAIRELAGRPDVPVFAGCAGPLKRALETAEGVHGVSGIDGANLPDPVWPLDERHAVDFLIETLTAAEEGSVTLATLGPLTNLATAFERAPDARAGVREIVSMGGSLGKGNVTPHAEYNIHTDPEAADAVYRAGCPITMIGLNLTHQVIALPERRAAIRAVGGAASAAVAGMLEFYGARKTGLAGAPMHDPCVIAYLLRPGLFEGRAMPVEIVIDDGAELGRTRCGGDGAANARVLETADADGFFALLLEKLARLKD